jgi:hypothetical protein
MSLPYKPGDSGQEITDWQGWFHRMYRSYAPSATGIYDIDSALATAELQRRLNLPPSEAKTGVFDQRTAEASGFIKSAAPATPAAPANTPVFFTVEGHSSNMFAGPVADTATQLESEGLCHHQPIGYNNAAIPFDNKSGVEELARLVGSDHMDNGVPFPAGTRWALGIFSQGSIVGYDFYVNYLAPGKPLEWREKDRVGTLAYGNPNRATDSIAPWATGWITKQGTHGLDPKARYGLNGVPVPANFMDVYREGDIFAENGDDKASEVKAAVYEAVARADFFSNPASIAAEIADLFSEPFTEVIGIVMAIISGITFLGTNPNPHYSPYDISGGINWMRERLRA